MVDRMRRSISRFLRRATDESIRADVIGALFILGGLLGSLSLIFPHPEQGEAAIWVVNGVAILAGSLLILRAPGVGTRVILAAVAFGSTLINVMMLSSGVATGVYAAMFCWVVLVSVNFFTPRQAIAQFAWMMGGFAVVLALVESGNGYSPFTRWLTATMALAVTGGATGWLVFRRRLAEQSTQRFIDLSQEMLCTIGPDGRFRKINPAWGRRLGYEPDELRGTSIEGLVHPADCPEMRRALADLRSGGEALAVENRCRMSNGNWQDVVWSATFSSEEKLVYARARPRRSELARAQTGSPLRQVTKT